MARTAIKYKSTLKNCKILSNNLWLLKANKKKFELKKENKCLKKNQESKMCIVPERKIQAFQSKELSCYFS